MKERNKIIKERGTGIEKATAPQLLNQCLNCVSILCLNVSSFFFLSKSLKNFYIAYRLLQQLNETGWNEPLSLIYSEWSYGSTVFTNLWTLDTHASFNGKICMRVSMGHASQLYNHWKNCQYESYSRQPNVAGQWIEWIGPSCVVMCM